jgi:putative ABC transport system permease protein
MNGHYLQLTFWQVGIAALLVVANGAVSVLLKLRLERSLLLASFRMVVQLVLVGFVLEAVFRWTTWYWVLALAIAMTLIAGVAAVWRTDRRFSGVYMSSIVSVTVSSWVMTMFALKGVLHGVTPWYDPQYSIPLLGMILGNTLSGISLGLNRLGDELAMRQDQVEMRLTLGATSWEAARPAIRQAVRIAMIPTINSMMVTGIVSLPGMMTGQLLSGIPPLEAVKYQIVIMFLIASGTALGSMGVVLLSFLRLFDSAHRFRYERILPVESHGEKA